jgi:hypothetical protein
MRIKERSARRLVAALLLLSVIPLAAGVFRLTSLACGAEITPANARFFEAPLPVVLHILSTSVSLAHSSSHPVCGGTSQASTARSGASWFYAACWQDLLGCG